MFNFAAFYRALYGEPGKTKNRGKRNQTSRVNMLLLGKYPVGETHEEIGTFKANKLIQGREATETVMELIDEVKQTKDIVPYFRDGLSQIFYGNVKSLYEAKDLNLEQSVKRVQAMLDAAGEHLTVRPEAGEDPRIRFLADALTIAVLNSRAIDQASNKSLFQKDTQDWEAAALRRDPSAAKEQQQVQKEQKTAQGQVLATHKVDGFETFFGRDQEIEDIHTAFDDRNVVFLHGLGGIGKSGIAQHYWQKKKSFYTTVVFASYEGDLAALVANDLVFSVRDASRRTNENHILQTDKEYARDKLELIKRNTDEHTLIILDNYDVDEDDFFETFIQNARFRTLITTRNEPECGKFFVLPVGPIDDEETLKKMFLKYARAAMLDENDPAFPALFEITERHTLTLELVAKYMADAGIHSVGEMVSLLEGKSLAVLSDTEGKDRYGRIRDLLRMTQINEKEKMFLRCMAMLPHTGVQQTLFRDWSKDIFSANARLERLSLIKLNNANKTVSMHPVIREVVLSELKPDYDSCRAFIERCAMVGEDHIPKMWALTYEEKRQRLSCYKSILSQVPEITTDTYQLYVNVSTMANYVAPFDDATNLHDRILKFAYKYFGEESDEAMLVLNKMGWKCSNVGKVEQAVEYYSKAAEWFIEHPNYRSREAHSCILACADSYCCRYIKHIGTDDQDMADYRKGFDYFRRCEEYGEKMKAFAQEENEEYQIYLEYQLASVDRILVKHYLEMGWYYAAEGALIGYREAIRNFEKKTNSLAESDWGNWHYYYGKIRYAMEDDLGYAIYCLEESRDIYLKYLGSQNAKMIDVLETLYLCYKKMGFLKEASGYLQEALDAATILYTSEHPVLMRLKEYQTEC